MSALILPQTENHPVCVLGGGVLGRRIACAWAAGGYDCNIRDPDEEQRASAVRYFETSISTFLAAEGGACGTVRAYDDLETAVKDAWLVIECFPERLDFKVNMCTELERHAPRDAMMCTISSSYVSREALEKVGDETKKGICNMHWTMSPQNKMVELMTDGQTDERVSSFLSQRLAEIGYLPVQARNEPTGFVISRMWAAIKREALMIVSQGVATPEELDSVWAEMYTKNTAGPCKMMDAVGLDTVSFVEQHYAKERNLPTEHTVDYLQRYIDEGKLGTKSSKGGLYPPGTAQETAQNSADHRDALHAPTIYFLDIGLSNSPKDFFNKGRILMGGTDGRPLKTLVDRQHMPDGIAISLNLGKIFWTSMGIPSANDGCVYSTNLDGSDIQVVVPVGNIHTGKQITIDRVNKKLYFCEREGLRVMRCNGDGSNHEVLVQNGDWRNPDEMKDQMRWCVGIAVSPSTGQFYWTQKGYSKSNQGKIMRANIDFPAGQNATNRTDIECVFQKLPESIDLECDEEGHILYWSDRGELPIGNSINRASFSRLRAITDPSVKSMPEEHYDLIARNMHETIGLAVDMKNKYIYCTDLSGTLYRFNLDGGGRRKYYDGEGSFTGLALMHV